MPLAFYFIGHKKLGENFIKHKANKDAKNNENQTPLHYAVKYGNFERSVYEFLWQFHWSFVLNIRLGEFEFAEMLINHGANVVVEDENHNTPMHLAVEEGIFVELFVSSIWSNLISSIQLKF